MLGRREVGETGKGFACRHSLVPWTTYTGHFTFPILSTFVMMSSCQHHSPNNVKMYLHFSNFQQPVCLCNRVPTRRAVSGSNILTCRCLNRVSSLPTDSPPATFKLFKGVIGFMHTMRTAQQRNR
eukprot:4545452-Amphidinium_carterae.1